MALGAVEGPDDVMIAAQLAAALEVSGFPKPGNIHREADLGPKTFERFLAGSIAIGPACRKAAERGMAVAEGSLKPSEVELGFLVEEAVRKDGAWQKTDPTHAGFAMLAVPLSASAGLALGKGLELDIAVLRSGVLELLRSSTVEDAKALYRALRASCSTKLGTLRPDVGLPDVFDPHAGEILAERGLRLWNVLEACSSWDLVARELCQGLKLSSEVGLRRLEEEMLEHGCLNTAIVNAYLALLAEAEDTHLARAWGLRETPLIPDAVWEGLEMAKKVSEEARRILELGGARTPEGLRALREMDEWLRSEGLNPGSCADLTACSLMLALLTWLRP